MDYLARAQECKEEIIENRRYLHQHPEIGFNLKETCSFVWDKLTEMGYEPKECGKSGIVATVGNKPGGKTILVRADMDALPMKEDSGLPFASTVDRAHTCGHDMHTAMLLGAAKLLMENEEALQGTVKLMFQPAEELISGAKSMIAAGVLEHPKVDAAMACHMQPTIPVGFIGYNTGVVTASSDSINITITGKGGHGAHPEECIDPINVAAHLYISLQDIINREISAEQAVVLTVGSIQAGHANNIIPETALMKCTLRTFDPEVRAYVLSRIPEMAELVAKTFRASAVVDIPESASSVVVDEVTAETIADGLRQMLGEQYVQKQNTRTSGAEDFSEVTQLVPSFFFALGGASMDRSEKFGLHNPMVKFDEGALPVGAAAFAQGATVWLEKQA